MAQKAVVHYTRTWSWPFEAIATTDEVELRPRLFRAASRRTVAHVFIDHRLVGGFGDGSGDLDRLVRGEA